MQSHLPSWLVWSPLPWIVQLVPAYKSQYLQFIFLHVLCPGDLWEFAKQHVLLSWTEIIGKGDLLPYTGFPLTGTTKPARYICTSSIGGVDIRVGRLKEEAFIRCSVPREENSVGFFFRGALRYLGFPLAIPAHNPASLPSADLCSSGVPTMQTIVVTHKRALPIGIRIQCCIGHRGHQNASQCACY